MFGSAYYVKFDVKIYVKGFSVLALEVWVCPLVQWNYESKIVHQNLDSKV